MSDTPGSLSLKKTYYKVLIEHPFFTPFMWFFKKGFLQGAFWSCMICAFSVSNDIFMRFLGSRLHVIEIVFFRFLFSMLTVIPFMMTQGKTLFVTKNPHLHVLRAIFGVGAISAICYSVNVMPLSENTTLTFTQPLFFLPLAVIFLKERVDAPRWIATIVGFLGILIIMQPGTNTFKLVAFFPIIAALLFAILDVLAKKMVTVSEHAVTMLFYFGLGTTLAAFIPLLFVWTMPTVFELFMLLCLGIGANMIQVCLFRAFSATDSSALMPFRYVELLFSTTFGFVLFGELPTLLLLAGAALIIISTFSISYVETHRKKKATTA